MNQNSITMDRRSMLHLSTLATLGCLTKTHASEGEERHSINNNPGEIEKRIIPSSGQKIATVGLGTWRGFDVDHSEEKRSGLKAVLKKLVEKGGAVIDSSPMYGASESVVGDLTSQLKIRPSVFLATKVWTSGKQQGVDQMNASFAKMKTEVIDLMQVHNLVDVHEHLKTLREWKEKGRIKYFGITHYTSSAYPELVRLIKDAKPDFVQFNYNISVRDAERELLPVARDKEVAIIINRPFEEGALFTMVNGKNIPGWAAEYDIKSWAQFFLKFILSYPGVTCVIPGTSKANHMEDNLGAAFGKMPDEKSRKKMAAYFND